MAHGLTQFKTKGRCIYCGIRSNDLSDEHIVPYSLGGQHVIKQASCKKCAAMTSKFERKVARDLWGDARIAFDAPSYRKTKRSSYIEVLNGRKKIDAKEYPAGFVFYKMDKPGYMQGLKTTDDISPKWKLIVIDDSNRREEYFRKYGEYPEIKFRHVPEDFGRMIAKIGYGQILTMFDPTEFSHICLPYILGQKSNISYVVGGGEKDVKPIPDTGYFLDTQFIANKEFNRMLLIAIVRLYANTHSPEYSVVVGELTSKEAIERAVKRFGGIAETKPAIFPS